MTGNTDIKTILKKYIIDLLDYCKKENWAGYDPYDALNSELLKFMPFMVFRFFRLGLTQIFKRNPINIRPFLMIPKTQNPKAIALFLKALIKHEKLGLLEEKDLIEYMVVKLIDLRSTGIKYWCWGYSFPWQGRQILVQRKEPNLVCTTFVADALIDSFELKRKPQYLEMAVSAGEYILNKLYWSDGKSIASFSYPLPSSRSQVHNANFLAAALLCRAYKHSGDKKFLALALKVARYSAAKQHEDGSWYYGESITQRWVDNFHTGYNLCALRTISECAETLEFENHIRRGFEFYRNNFFNEDGSPKYYHNKKFPIDIHCVAQSIITLLAFKGFNDNNGNIAEATFKWAMTNLWNKQGYFYYQMHRFYKNRISYMRWSQAWMLLALTTLLEHWLKEA